MVAGIRLYQDMISWDSIGVQIQGCVNFHEKPRNRLAA
jgi:hypothetical protein